MGCVCCGFLKQSPAYQHTLGRMGVEEGMMGKKVSGWMEHERRRKSDATQGQAELLGTETVTSKKKTFLCEAM